MVWQLKNGFGLGELVESDRKWEIVNLGKRNEILRADYKATQNRKQGSKKSLIW